MQIPSKYGGTRRLQNRAVLKDCLLLDNQRDIFVSFRLDVFAYFMLETYNMDLQPLPRNTGKAVKVYTVSYSRALALNRQTT